MKNSAKEKGTITYIILIVLLGVALILSIPRAFGGDLLFILLSGFFALMLTLTGWIFRQYRKLGWKWN